MAIGNLLTDLEGGALAVGGADAGILQDAGVGVGEQRVERAAGDGHGEVGGVEVGEQLRVKVDVVVVAVPGVVRRCRRWWWCCWGWPAG